MTADVGTSARTTTTRIVKGNTISQGDQVIIIRTVYRFRYSASWLIVCVVAELITALVSH